MRETKQLPLFDNTLHNADNAVTTMKSLGHSHDLAPSTNSRAALEKLPDPLREKWAEEIEMHPAISTLVDLDGWFLAIPYALEAVEGRNDWQ